MGSSGIAFTLRLGVLALCITAFLYCITQTSWVATTFLCAVAVVAAFLWLRGHLLREQRQLEAFLQAIEHEDFTASAGIGSPRELLHIQLRVAERLRSLRLRNEAQHRYLESIVTHIHVALICIAADQSIRIFNRAAQLLLGIGRPADFATLEQAFPELAAAIRVARPGARELFKFSDTRGPTQVMIGVSVFTLEGQEHRLVSLQNIQQEMQWHEVDAWQKLLRVLTHELMNSMTPVVSLASLSEELLRGRERAPSSNGEVVIGGTDFDSLQRSIGSIAARSQGLVKFVTAFRNLSLSTEPCYANVQLQAVFHRVQTLMQRELEQAGIALTLVTDPPELSIAVDPGMLEQILINLLKNSIDALTARPAPQIVLSAMLDPKENVLVTVHDNGVGIPRGNVETVFTPFFTTKPNGNGIGLSLSRQLMRLNRGHISLNSEEGRGTTVMLTFRRHLSPAATNEPRPS